MKNEKKMFKVKQLIYKDLKEISFNNINQKMTDLQAKNQGCLLIHLIPAPLEPLCEIGA